MLLLELPLRRGREMDTLSPKAPESSGMSGARAGGGLLHGHGPMMLTCVPMIVVVAALLATGVIGASGLLFVLPCVAMMGAMMFLMARGRRDPRDR
jgi:hypothetical protein